MYFTIEPAFAPLDNLLGIGYPNALIIFENNKVTWLLDEKEFTNQSRNFVSKIIMPDLGENYFNLWENLTNSLVSVFGEIDRNNLQNLPEKDLKSLYEKFKKAYWEWWALAISIELVTASIESDLGKKLKSYYGGDEEREFNRDFAMLTSPIVLTFYRRERKDLLDIYKLPKDKQKKALKEHQKKYYWILNSYYEGRVLGVDYFKEELGKVTGKEFEEISREINNSQINISKQKEEITSRRNIDDKTKNLILLVERISSLQDDRKMYNFKADHYLELFVREFARGYKRNIIDLKSCLPDELLSIDRISDDILFARQESWVFECEGRNIKSIVGKDANRIAMNFSSVKNVQESMIHGVVASVGQSFHFRGTAKIILTIDEIDKLEEGDILVTTMTSPDFVLCMKKSGAIITDVGGILSHAAIVSRELGKPCIVGTEVATKVIKDGDVVEIHSGRGTVKVVKRGYNEN